MTILCDPRTSLELGHWFKLICGASYQDVSVIRNLSLVYSLAGADCIDVAADVSVVQAALDGGEAFRVLSGQPWRPWLMASFNAGRDPHFRKAWFDPQRCPVDCNRPCSSVCPAAAILPSEPLTQFAGVIAERCYGCGRCLSVCPHGLIEEHSFTVAAAVVVPGLIAHIDAIEIHTQMGRQVEFRHLWQQIAPYVGRLKLVAVSCPDSEPRTDGIVDYLTHLYSLMTPKPHRLLWQADGRSMSGDIGKGTTHATIRLGQKLLNASLPGYVQLAGGTNDHTVAKLRSQNLLNPSPHAPSIQDGKSIINGIGYGSYARCLLDVGQDPVENDPERLWQQVSLARDLVRQLKPNLPAVSPQLMGLGDPRLGPAVSATGPP